MNRPNTAQTVVHAEIFARRVTARLSEAEADLDYDISERLRAARERALSRRKVVAVPAIARQPQQEAAAPSGKRNWWRAVVSAVPLSAMVAGLAFFNGVQADEGASEMAEYDATLLADELPPSAYTDPGFTQFLKTAAQKQPTDKR
ncbi:MULTISPECIES: DUF3619 family protein [Comamonas]|jgi:negative regulator of sigma E activity|uniref:DUF3619 family protein n=1 Tax=Comamonas sediminis TaxID=1783360 RepID=A0ABV4B8K3_9BURK|nr:MULTISPECIES: DUF3619 family protein [unclassified Comamonas]ULR87281.1 DUF3619 family protein [Comamonas sp. B21-038]